MTKPLVYIVESPSSADLFDGRTEGRALCEALQAIGYSHSYVLAADAQQFVRALQVGPGSHLATELGKHGNVSPIIHLSMHGSLEGIALTDGTRVQWQDLKHLLHPLNEAIPTGLAICISACGGAAGIRMAMSEDKNKPFFFLVGTFEAVAWQDALVGFITLYHCWARDHPIEEAVNRMKGASTHDGFGVFFGAIQKQHYIEYVSKQRLIEALTRQPPTQVPSGGLLGLSSQDSSTTDTSG